MLSLRKVSVWIFGEEGDILADSATRALIVASSILVTGSMLVSPLIADLAQVFDVTETYAGWLIISFTAAAAVTLPLVGALADRTGRKPIMTAGLVVFGSAGAAIGIVTKFELALILRALQGVGFACTSAIVLTLFGDLYDGARETTVQGMRVSINSIMNTVAPLAAGVLFVYSWRYPFVVYLLAIPAAIWVWLTVPRIAPANDWSFRTYIRKTMSFLTRGVITSLMLSFMFRFVLFYGLLTYISVLATQEVGLSVVAVGALLSIRGVVKTLSSTQAGRLSLSYDPALLSVGGFLSLAAGVVLMGVFPTTAMLTVAIIMVGVGDGILSPSQKSLVNRLSPSKFRGGTMSTALTFQNVGKVIGPIGFGTVISVFDLASAFILLGAVNGALGICSLLCVLVWRNY